MSERTRERERTARRTIHGKVHESCEAVLTDRELALEIDGSSSETGPDTHQGRHDAVLIDGHSDLSCVVD